MGLMVPLFLANSEYHSWWWAVVGLVFSIVYTIFGFYINLTQLAAQGDRKDIFGVLLRSLSIINILLCTLGFGWLLYRRIMVHLRKWMYETDIAVRNHENEVFVSRLLLRGKPRPPKIDDNDDNDTPKGIVARIQQTWADWTSTTSKQNEDANIGDVVDEKKALTDSTDVIKYGTVDNKGKRTISTASSSSTASILTVKRFHSVKDMPYHEEKDFEVGDIAFHYPQRLLFALGLTLVLLFISLLGCVVFLRWLASFILKAKAFLVGLQFRDNQFDLAYILEVNIL
jgi:hypothetical protein